MRGTFANIRLRNELAEGKEGPYTVAPPRATRQFIYDAAMRYAAEGVPLVLLAGREYGSGSSRDWAAKGTALLGVRAVIAESYERIHRSNLVGMGVLPLQFKPGDTAASLGLTGRETFTIEGLADGSRRAQSVAVRVTDEAVATPLRGHRPAGRPDRGRLLPPGRDPAGRAPPPRTPRRLRESRRPCAAGSVPDISPRNQRQGCALWSAVRHQRGSYLAVNWRRERPNPKAWDD